jgi:hypothetical protein
MVAPNRVKLGCLEYAVNESLAPSELLWRRDQLLDNSALHRWMPPELLVNRRPCTESSDVFSFLVVVAELTTGLLPWATLGDEVIVNALKDPPEVTLPRTVHNFPGFLLAEFQVNTQHGKRLTKLSMTRINELINYLCDNFFTAADDAYDSVGTSSSSSSEEGTGDNKEIEEETHEMNTSELFMSMISNQSQSPEQEPEVVPRRKDKKPEIETYAFFQPEVVPRRKDKKPEVDEPTPPRRRKNKEVKESEQDIRVQILPPRRKREQQKLDPPIRRSPSEAVKPASHFNTIHGRSCSLSKPHLIGGPTSTSGSHLAEHPDFSRPGSITSICSRPSSGAEYFAAGDTFDLNAPCPPPRRKRDGVSPYRMLPKEIVRVVLPDSTTSTVNSSYRTSQTSFDTKNPFETKVSRSQLETRKPVKEASVERRVVEGKNNNYKLLRYMKN